MSMASETFALDGTRCAGCVLKIERTLAALPGVALARGNATHHRMRLVWDSDRQSPESLTREIAALGYQAHRIVDTAVADREPSLLPRLAVAGLGMMNIMLLSLSVWFGLATDMGEGTLQMFHWISAAIALPVAAYSGAVFHGPALRALRAGRMTMDTPITLGIWITLAASFWETLRGADEVYFDAAIALIFFLLIGRVLEQAMRRRSGNAAENLRELIDETATVLDPGGAMREVETEALKPGVVLLVKAGERVPADGRLLSDAASFDESALTGETLPRIAGHGAMVAAGAVLVEGPAKLCVTHVGEESQIGQMAQLIDDVTAHKGHLQQLSDRFARGYIPTVLGGGALGFGFWYFALGASFTDALMIAVAVLIVTCPCAAGLATPAVTSRAINLAMRAGLIIKSGLALERLGAVDHVVIDKTGTASQPLLSVDPSLDPAMLQDARRLAAGSHHPLARALLDGQPSRPLDGLIEVPGQGVEAPDGARLGNAAFVGLKPHAGSGPAICYRSATGQGVRIGFTELPRPDLPAILEELAERSIPVTLLSGDTEAAVQSFAQRSGIPHAVAAQSPAQKLEYVQALQDTGHTVLMIGDGINDSPSLAGADVSVSFAGASQIAQVSADVVLTTPKLSLIPKALILARKARRLIVQNLVFSTLYNVCAVPLALAGLLTPAVAAMLMSASSLVVLLNGARIGRAL